MVLLHRGAASGRGPACLCKSPVSISRFSTSACTRGLATLSLYQARNAVHRVSSSNGSSEASTKAAWNGTPVQSQGNSPNVLTVANGCDQPAQSSGHNNALNDDTPPPQVSAIAHAASVWSVDQGAGTASNARSGSSSSDEEQPSALGHVASRWSVSSLDEGGMGSKSTTTFPGPSADIAAPHSSHDNSIQSAEMLSEDSAPEHDASSTSHIPGMDAEDTPESLTDVEFSSVAPAADLFQSRDDILILAYALATGAVVGSSVFLFDVSIQYIHDLPDILSRVGIGGGRSLGVPFPGGVYVPFRCIMPIGAGMYVAWIQTKGFSPSLKVLTRAIEGVVEDSNTAALPSSYWQVFHKASASAVTLGSGASLGPEAPSVELGANTAALLAPKSLSRRRQRMLIAAGTAAGVSAAFDAPVAGALFAVEFVLKSSRLGLDRLSTSAVFVSTSVAAGVVGFLRAKGQALGLTGAASHLVGRIPYFSIQPNILYDVLQFSCLGLCCAVASVLLYEGVRISEATLRPLPRYISAPLAGLMCGIVALGFPQVQYGYVNLEEIFRDSTKMSSGDLVMLLVAKVVATSVCVGGGLVGGLFAPSLFLGAIVGDITSHFVAEPWGVVDSTSFVVVGAAAVLGAACRAPLTSVALMVEITRDTGLLIPLLASVGVASMFTDYLEGKFSRVLEGVMVEQYLREKAMFWGASLPSSPSREPDVSNTVQGLMAATTNMYVRHTLPLEQARTAMLERKVKTAIVVDDNFSPMGVVYLRDIEDEIIRRQLMNEPDNNFDQRN